MTQPSPVTGSRPVGTPRNPTTVAILAIVTCGIYGLYWAYLTFEELKQYNGEGAGGALGAIMTWIIVGWFILPQEIQKMYQADGKTSPVEPIVGVWLFLPIIGYFIYLNKVQGALNDFWVSKGATPAT